MKGRKIVSGRNRRARLPRMSHPCLSCGACCAYFRVSFYSSEALPASYHVPGHVSVSISSEESVMEGTDRVQSPRCVALSGRVGKDATCTIYENRPSACRKFEASFSYGVKEPRCDEARSAHGMLPLTLRDYDGFRNRSASK